MQGIRYRRRIGGITKTQLDQLDGLGYQAQPARVHIVADNMTSQITFKPVWCRTCLSLFVAFSSHLARIFNANDREPAVSQIVVYVTCAVDA